MLSVFLCALVALCKRIAMKRKLEEKRKQLESRKSSLGSECGGFEDHVGGSNIAEILYFATGFAVFPGDPRYWSNNMPRHQYQPTQQSYGYLLPHKTLSYQTQSYQTNYPEISYLNQTHVDESHLHHQTPLHQTLSLPGYPAGLLEGYREDT